MILSATHAIPLDLLGCARKGGETGLHDTLCERILVKLATSEEEVGAGGISGERIDSLSAWCAL